MRSHNPAKIIFTDTLGVDSAYQPMPCIKHIPDWYVDTPEYVNGERVITDGQTPHTVKKCMPVFDAMTAGYMISTFVDVQVTSRDGFPYYEWPHFDAIGFHPVEQAPLIPGGNGNPFPKWNSAWAIKTAPGYSSLFIPPLHNPNGIFTALPGIVDTDTYNIPVNFPFILDDAEWRGIIPAGTPLVQVIPIHRRSWKMQIEREPDRREQERLFGKLRSLWFNSYKRQFWIRKEYR